MSNCRKEITRISTPTVVASSEFSGITEIRPGNYVFMDRSQLSKNYKDVSFANIALFVVATGIYQ